MSGRISVRNFRVISRKKIWRVEVPERIPDEISGETVRIIPEAFSREIWEGISGESVE